MPTREAPSCNSTRVQKAYRLNNIEQTRLHRQLVLLDRELQHVVRSSTQEKRRAQITLDHIGAHSGHSPLGLAPQEVAQYAQDDSDPTFMYGERQKSRRFGKFRRAQSAFQPGSKRDVSDANSEAGSVTSSVRSRRPKTSPVKRTPAATSIGFDDVVARAMSRSQTRQEAQELSSDDERGSVDLPESISSQKTIRQGRSNFQRPASTIPSRYESPSPPDGQNTTPDRPKTSHELIRHGTMEINESDLNANNANSRKKSNNKHGFKQKQAFEKKSTTNDEIKNISKSLRNAKLQKDEVDTPTLNIDIDNTKAYDPPNPTLRHRKPQGAQPHARNSPIVQIVNKARMMSGAAKRWRNMATKGHSIKPNDDDATVNWAVKKEKSQAKLDLAVTMHTKQKGSVNDRLQDFLKQYSIKRYTTDGDDEVVPEGTR